MANHKSAKKRMRQDAKKRLHNRFYKKTTRTLIQKLRSVEEKEDAEKLLPVILGQVDRLSKRGVWHKNKASNLKSKLTKYVNSLSS